MQIAPRLNTLVKQYDASGDLGPNSQKGPLKDDQDNVTLTSMCMTLQLLTELDNQDGVDLDPAPGKVRFTPESLDNMKTLKSAGDEMVGSFRVDESQQNAEMQFESFGSVPMAVNYRMTANSATIVAIEARGENFEASALKFLPASDQCGRVSRTGSWSELS